VSSCLIITVVAPPCGSSWRWLSDIIMSIVYRYSLLLLILTLGGATISRDMYMYLYGRAGVDIVGSAQVAID
jgi:hypothetical protein